jgi:cardiolipin synthase
MAARPLTYLDRLRTPALWRGRDLVVVGLVLAVLFEAATAALRFGLGLRSTRDTSLLAPYTFGVRVHHGYVGAVMLLAAVFVRWKVLRQWMVVLGLALVVSDLLHHFAVLWPATGDPEFHLVYPPETDTHFPEPDTHNPTFWGGLIWVTAWVIRLVMLAVVPGGRPPASAAAWLLTIFLFPYLGLALFVLIGAQRMPRWRRDRLERFDEVVAPLLARVQAALGGRKAAVPDPLVPVARLSERLGDYPVTPGNRVEFLTDYEANLARIAADVDAAAHHAHLYFYIAAADATTEPVMAALVRAAGRGVRCRLVYDAVGSRPFARSLHKRLDGTGVELRAALPVRLLTFRGPRFDLRNHRKIVAVDGRVGYVGSQNLIDRHFRPGVAYEDLLVRVEGPVVTQLQLVFACDWWLETDEQLTDPEYFPAPVEPGTEAAQALPSGPDFATENFQRVLVDMVHQARREVTLVTPYFIPDEALLQALETAAHRKVRVRVVVSAETDQLVVRLCQESYYAELLADGVEVYRYRGRFLHAKLATIDDTFCVVGSGNADVRSFRLNAEISLLLYTPAAAAAAAALEDSYVAKSERLTADQWTARPGWRRLVQNLARIWSPLF